jgi:ABC-type nitrate/sulfonate/bicarbonate transport system permease component
MKASSVPKKKPTAQIIASSLGFLTIILLWIIISALHQNDIIFPGIISTLKVFFSLFQRGSTYFILLNTIGGLILVLVLSFLTALILSLISLKFPTFKSYITPFLALFKIKCFRFKSLIIFISVISK